MMQMSCYGRLGGDPKSIDTSSGKPMAVASLAVEIPERGTEEPAPEWIGVVAFGGVAEKLAKHAKGECVSVSGRVQRNRWSDRDGNERVQLQVVADSIVSARTVRPGGGRDRTRGATRREPEAAGAGAPAEDFDDDIPL